jgi:hypothetical protein
VILDKPYNTSELVSLTGIIGAAGWIGTIVFGRVLYSSLSLGNLVIALSFGWLILTIGSSYYINKNTKDYVLEADIWKVWFWLSIGGIVVNIASGAVLELGLVSAESAAIETFPMEYGVILPWMAVYAIGNIATALYNLDNKKALSKSERIVYGLIGVISLIGTVALGLMPTLHRPMILLLILLSVAQIATIVLRD